MPIISIFLGYFFFKEPLSAKGKLSIFLILVSVFYLLLTSIKIIPWVGLIVAMSWSFYNVLRKKVNVETDIGLFIESLYILPFVLVVFYFISVKLKGSKMNSFRPNLNEFLSEFR